MDDRAREPFVLAFADLSPAARPPEADSLAGDVDKSAGALVGGKGANLGEMARAGFPVPPGFCVTTHAYRAVTSSPPAKPLQQLLDEVARVSNDDLAAVSAVAAKLREHVASLPIPADVERAIVDAWRALGEEHAYAVRSSATAEDLPGASFAGQQDTYLNVVGRDELLRKVRACWASLFTDRAILYRAKNGFDHRKVLLAVVVQRQIAADSAGILFTADPINGKRSVVSIDAGFGLGEALVSGLVNADLYKVDKRSLAIVDKKLGDKRIAIRALQGGGTVREELEERERHAQVLDDARIVALAKLGVDVEKHYGAPQDIEWCFEKDALYLVQARPITTLFPVPVGGTVGDDGLRVFLSFGHVQVMTDAMKPFALSVLRRLIPFGRNERGASRYVAIAGSRLWMDLTDVMRVGPPRKMLLRIFKLVDAGVAGDVGDVVAREEFLAAKRVVPARKVIAGIAWFMRIALPRALAWLLFWDAKNAPSILRAQMDAWWEGEQRRTSTMSARERLQYAVDGLRDFMPRVFFKVAPAILAGGITAGIVRKLAKHGDWDALARGLEGNATTEMDLAIGDLADVARKSPSLSARLREDPLPSREEAASLSPDFGDAFARFLDVYGVRGTSEIDLTRPRFRDDPRFVLQVIRGNLAHESAGAHRAHHRRMKDAAQRAVDDIVANASWWKRGLLRRLIRRQRGLVAVREHPKFQLIRQLWLIRQAALELGIDDVFMYTLDEVLSGATVDVDERKAQLALDQKRAPPRVITSEGEVVVARRDRQLPPGALAGTGASAGVVEGVARVILDPNQGALHAGEILVAPFTDPGWTPLFINAKAVVIEVGGMMTHGSVVAREYGIPAVVSVEGATKKIKTGQRLRVDGGNGVVEILA